MRVKGMIGLVMVWGACVSLALAEEKTIPMPHCDERMQGAGKSHKMMRLFQSVPPQKATILQSGKAKAFCPECGMTLSMFFKTNHSGKIEGKAEQFCSIHCLVKALKQGKKIEDIQVVDTTSLAFIDAKKAYYVVGSHKRGTMTRVSKYAFAKKADAQAFMAKNGGDLTNFEGALKEATADFPKDTQMVAKKQMTMAKKGEILYGKMCRPTTQTFASTAEAKAFVLSEKLCKPLNGKQLQAIGLYLQHR